MVGNLKEKWLIQAIAEYAKRLQRYCRFNVIELKEQKIPQKASGGEIDIALKKEGDQILSKIPSRAKVVAMCIEGKEISSEGFASRLQDFSRETSNVAFIIGSSHGLSPEVKKVADFKMSLSPMTFPHQLTRVILTEQIYRAFSINAGAKYHK